MTFLLALWTASLALAASSLMLMVALIVRRVIADRQEARRVRRRESLITLVLRALDEPDGALSLLGAIRPNDRFLIADIIFDLLRNVRGPDRQGLSTLLEDLGLIEDDLAALRHGRSRQRAAAVQRLAQVDRAWVDETLKAALDDRSPGVRLAAASALAERGSKVDPRVVVTKLAIGTRESSRVLRSIFRKLARNSPGEIISLLQGSDSDLVKVLAIDALGTAGHYAALPALIAVAHEGTINIRANALRALGLLGHPDAAPAVMAGLTDKAWQVRTQAAISAGRLGIVEALPQLVALLDDAQWWVRYRSAQTLRRFGQAGIHALESASCSGSRAGRVAQMLLEERAA